MWSIGFHVFLTRATYVQGKPINVCLYNLKENEIPKTKFGTVITFWWERNAIREPHRGILKVMVFWPARYVFNKTIMQTIFKGRVFNNKV